MLWSLLVILVIATFLMTILIRTFKLPQLPRERAQSFVERACRGPIAHRCGKPENTLVAITLSHENGASGIEVDLTFSKDGHPVLLHDSRIDRTSNGRGRVQDMTLNQLKKLDFGVKTGGPDFTNERMPTLDEAIELCENLDILMLLELKGHSDKSAQVVKELFSKNPSLYNRVAVISFYPNILYKVRRADENILVGLVTRSYVLSFDVSGSPRNPNSWKHYGALLLDFIYPLLVQTILWRVLGFNLLIANKNDILSGKVVPSVWESRGVSTIAWTVNNKEEKSRFKYIFKIPFLSDYVAMDCSVPEQQC